MLHAAKDLLFPERVLVVILSVILSGEAIT